MRKTKAQWAALVVALAALAGAVVIIAEQVAR
jgi:hypothetical protein